MSKKWHSLSLLHSFSLKPILLVIRIASACFLVVLTWNMNPFYLKTVSSIVGEVHFWEVANWWIMFSNIIHLCLLIGKLRDEDAEPLLGQQKCSARDRDGVCAEQSAQDPTVSPTGSRAIGRNKCIPNTTVCWLWEDCAGGRPEGVRDTVFPAHFCCEPETTLKNEV